MNKYLVISDEVKMSIEKNHPIVALESTIISHGMPYPQNVQTALKIEAIIRKNQVTPATIAIINGALKVGLTKDEIEYIGKNKEKIHKTSIRDIPYILSQKLDGATTVSATSFIASLSKIKIFATGGIGGVHRKAETSFDISTDLETLATINVAVVCSGAKSILDLGKTLEYLETKGVDVIGYQTDILPAFYTSKSDFKVNHQLNSYQEIANLIKTKWEIGLKGGVLITNPIPKEYEIESEIINQVIEKALEDAERINITGNNITPFLLNKIREITHDNSLEANIQLVYNNAHLAAQIAKRL